MTSDGTGLSDLEYLSDLVLISSDGVKFPVHKVFLAKRSGVLAGLFSSGCTPSKSAVKAPLDVEYSGAQPKETLTLPDVSSGIMKALVDLNYLEPGGNLPESLNLDNMKEVAETARKYDFQHISFLCDQFCTENVILEDKFSSVEWHAYAKEYGFSKFASKCEERMGRALVSILRGATGKALGELPNETLVALLKASARHIGVTIPYE